MQDTDIQITKKHPRLRMLCDINQIYISCARAKSLRLMPRSQLAQPEYP